ncbi:arylsulfatase [uncultured Algibacter sp.]|uniref:arylsulfatase n=1 Tax=uncultured Algibacter sp. TaxID=298659 RepID=UPI002614663C|nr:arylsulfatase [uncultured Algibacter sp.]
MLKANIIRLGIIILTTIFVSCKDTSEEKQTPQPNILIIQADDMGFDDLSLHGNPYLETPNLDKLGNESVQFEQFYLQNVCAPSRAALLTGRNYLRTGVTSVHAGRDFMNLDETTIAEIFQKNGYNTGMWGKWHSGKTDGYFPWDRGFDEAYYACLYNYWNNTGLLNGKPIQTKGFTTDALTDMAIDFVTQEREGKPFFAYMSHLAPHNPWRAPESYIKKYEDKGLSKPMATLYGMIDNLDHNIGRLLDALDKNGLTENTIIVFMSDNGPWTRSYRFGLTEKEWQMRNPSGLRGTKGENWQNGVKSTLFVKWKDQLLPKKVNHLAKIEDILPSLASMSHIELPESLTLDGTDFSPIFDGKNVVKNPIFFANHSPKGSSTENTEDAMITASSPLTKDFKSTFHFKNQGLAIRKGDFKYIQNQGRIRQGLYNVINDPKEFHNLIDSLPAKTSELEKELSIWYQGILKANSFNMPTLQIGFKDRAFTQIYAASPSYISNGLINRNHNLQGWSKVSDSAIYKIKVHTPGKYKVFLVNKMPNPNEVQFSVSTEKNSITSTLTDSAHRNFETLLEGESAYWEDFDKPETFKKDIIKSEIGVLQLTKSDSFLYVSPQQIQHKEHQERQLIAIQLYRVK